MLRKNSVTADGPAHRHRSRMLVAALSLCVTAAAQEIANRHGIRSRHEFHFHARGIEQQIRFRDAEACDRAVNALRSTCHNNAAARATLNVDAMA